MNTKFVSWGWASLALLSMVACSAEPEAAPEEVATTGQALGSGHIELIRTRTCNSSNACTDSDFRPSDLYQGDPNSSIDTFANDLGFPTWITDNLGTSGSSAHIEARYYDLTYQALSLDNVFEWTALPGHGISGREVSIRMTDGPERQWIGSWGTGGLWGSVSYQIYYQKTHAVCSAWKSISFRENWQGGSTDTCSPGTDESGRTNALALINLYRGMVGLQPIGSSYISNIPDPQQEDPQSCALMQMANPSTLNHYPPSSWKCWTQTGYNAAGQANISASGGVAAVRHFVSEDDGDQVDLGHRQLVLSQALTSVDLGSTRTHSCMVRRLENGPWTHDGYVAWPSGYVPSTALQIVGDGNSRDKVGWSIQTDAPYLADLCTSNSLQITVNRLSYDVYDRGTPRGAPKTFYYARSNTDPNTTVSPVRSFGANCVIKFKPQWLTGSSPEWYHVKVSGIANPFEYDVNIVHCGYYGR